MKLWIILALVSVNLACVAKVKMDIYYESLCPDSMRFFSDELTPLYNNFKQHMDITFIPFGKSNSYETAESEIEFECQHGPDECFGNKVQGCMLSRILDQDTQFAYLSCQMVIGADRTHQTCVEQFGFDWNEIVQCTQSEFATRQQLGYEQITTPVLQQTNWVPTIAYNGRIDENSIGGRAPPLKELLCDLIYNTNPACKVKRY
ncbi:CLUMA_CG012046, isoform A [Clunio marinus]|uniref:CLUMA_CG012046, isoform A n=1 Tax=Clunio marinus TaxID=568069 RepID=A0A1J1IK42_9DIPT|nr:CLUMA_CG012046, isoform A [Clunio marinus]